MKKILKKLGVRKMDEMERCIAFKSQRNAFFFIMIALFAWSIYEAYKVYAFHTSLNIFPCLLLVVSLCVQIFSQLIMTRNAVKDDEDSFETSPLLKIIIWVCVVAGVIITVGTAIIIMGVHL